MQLPNLDNLLNYQNQAVLKLYVQNYPDNKLKAEEAFPEVLKYLWLVRKHQIEKQVGNNKQLPQECFMPRSMQEIDQMWHEFILFTADYTDFCYQYFGNYMHHLPNIFDNAPRPRNEIEDDIEKMLHYIYDNLGEQTVKTWFTDYI